MLIEPSCTRFVNGAMQMSMSGDCRQETRGGCPVIFSVCFPPELTKCDEMVNSEYLTANWVRISTIANENSFYMNYVDFWAHPDPDMLEVGNGNLTLAENRAHFALWAMMKSPLIIGTAVSFQTSFWLR